MKKYFIIFLVAVSYLLIQSTLIDHEPADKAELGKILFFDPILSRDYTISCASCHLPDHAFADTSAVSKGVEKKTGLRNTPSSMNLSLQRTFFWDGRAKSLEEQALAPIENPVEMDLPVDTALVRLQANKKYMAFFRNVFNSEPTRTNLAEALAAFERTLETSNSPFDDWKFADNPKAVHDDVKRGFNVFNTKGKCIQCHFGPDFTTSDFRNIGLFNGRDLNDSGRAVISGKTDDLGKFKVGSLRNVAVTAPYMHNGMFKSLADVIEFYNDPQKIIHNSINRDSLLLQPLGLTEAEKKDLEAFLVSLTDKRFQGSISQSR